MSNQDPPEPALPPEGVGKPDAAAYGKGLGPGLGVNLLVSDMARSVRFQAGVLGARIDYWDRDFAILGHGATYWMLHHDRTYHANPARGIAQAAEGRGAGIELQIYGCDPETAVARAEAFGGTVLAGPADKPHGLREAQILDHDGYLWVPSVPLL